MHSRVKKVLFNFIKVNNNNHSTGQTTDIVQVERAPSPPT